MEILTLENLSFTYPLCTQKALDGISFRVQEGDFICLCAPTGSGKSTLLRLLKKELSPKGERTGTIRYKGTELSLLSCEDSAKSIGFVMQDPNQQIVTDKVWHELAFGLENLGVPPEEIRRRVAEMATYFGIDKWFMKNTDELSGGQKQLLNLASVMAMQPDVLILDEPTAQLDPIAALDFLSTVKRLHTELSTTVIIAEHRLEDVMVLCDKLLMLDGGKLTAYGAVRTVCEGITDEKALRYMPCAVRLHRELASPLPCPLTVREGRKLITENYQNTIRHIDRVPKTLSQEKAVELDRVFFRYGRQMPDVLSGLSLTVYKGESLCILGANGSGKSTALSVIAGLLTPYSGKVNIFGKKIQSYRGNELYKGCLTMLCQDVQSVFCKDTVRQELDCCGFEEADFPYDFSRLYGKHPYDLSGGEQQLTAMAKAIAQKPQLLLLDEPTKGLDVNTKETVIRILKELKEKGITVVTVTHDVEFALAVSDRCALFFNGSIVCTEPPEQFFSSNSFYTTAASRMTKGYYDSAVTVADIRTLCLKNGMKQEDRT